MKSPKWGSKACKVIWCSFAKFKSGGISAGGRRFGQQDKSFARKKDTASRSNSTTLTNKQQHRPLCRHDDGDQIQFQCTTYYSMHYNQQANINLLSSCLLLSCWVLITQKAWLLGKNSMGAVLSDRPVGGWLDYRAPKNLIQSWCYHTYIQFFLHLVEMPWSQWSCGQTITQ